MSQPVLFPYISGLDKYYGMTVEEAIKAKFETNPDKYNNIPKTQIFSYGDSNLGWVGKEEELVHLFCNVPLIQSEVELLTYLEIYGRKPKNPLHLRHATLSLIAEICLQIEKNRT